MSGVCKSLRTTLSNALNFLNRSSYLACFSWAIMVACRWLGDQGQVPSNYRWTTWMHSELWIVFTRSERNKYKFCSCTVHISSFGNCGHALTTLQMTAKPASQWCNGLCCIWKEQHDQLFDICHPPRKCKLLGFTDGQKISVACVLLMCCCHSLSWDSPKQDAKYLLPHFPFHFLLQGWSQ